MTTKTVRQADATAVAAITYNDQVALKTGAIEKNGTWVFNEIIRNQFGSH